MEQLLTGLGVDDLSVLLGSRTRALAAARWLYAGETPDSLPERIPRVSPEAWRAVRERCVHALPRVVGRHASADGTVKYALQTQGATVETVLIPGRGRSTACVSSQAGCTRDCAFCATARVGFSRNLRAGEMVGQFLVARAGAPAGAPLRNVVFMGMGEPLDNLDEVLQALEVLGQAPAPQLSASHLTVSTSGPVPAMRRFLARSRANLALSLNATTDALRWRLMPGVRSWTLSEVLEPLRADHTGRLFFLEYVMLAGVNDGDEDARRLVALLEGIRARVNLIPFNPVEGSGLSASPVGRVLAFRDLVHRAGVRCLLRSERGAGIDAACGQLAARPA